MTLRRGHGFSVRQTTPLLYLAAFVLCLGGWVGAALIAAGDWDGLETVEIHTLTAGNAVPVTENGIAIFTNIEQDRKVTCRSEQKGSVSLSDPGFDFTTERGSGEWHLLAVSKEAKPGNYAIGCTPGTACPTAPSTVTPTCPIFAAPPSATVSEASPHWLPSY